MPASRRRKPFCWRPRIANAPSAGEQAGREQRNAEEQVEAECRAYDLGHIAGRRDDLGLDPEPDRGSPREGVPAGLREVLTGCDPQLGGLGLDDHRDQVRSEDDPEQQIAELGAPGDVGGEVARVDVGDGRDEGRAEEGPDATQPFGVSVERTPGRARHGRLSRQDVLDPAQSVAARGWRRELAGNRLREVDAVRLTDLGESRSLIPRLAALSCSLPARVRADGCGRRPRSPRARRMARGS